MPASSPEADTESGLASPVDYLDKIFQIPYVLAPPPPTAMASYLGSLLPPAAASTVTPPVPATVAAMESEAAGLRSNSQEHEGPMTTGAENRASNDTNSTISRRSSGRMPLTASAQANPAIIPKKSSLPSSGSRSRTLAYPICAHLTCR